MNASGPEFEPNSGQAQSRYLFLARAGVTRAYIEDRAVEFSSASANRARLSWVDAAPSAKNRADWALTDPTGHFSYYCNQPRIDLCRQAVPGYGRLTRVGLYPKIDWVLHGRGEQFEYDLIVHPGGSLKNARIRVEGATARLDSEGRLRAGDLVQWRPEAYQWIDGKRIAVAASLRELGDSEFEFVAGPHRTDRDLIVDPVIQTIAVAGGSDEDAIVGSASGCSYRYGTTRSADWSQLAGHGRSIFVQYGGKTIFWGGDGDSQIGGADADLTNCILYLVGWTSARNAPVLSAPFDPLVPRLYAGGATDGFLLEVGRGGLAVAGYLGGPGADRLYDVRLTVANGYRGPLALAGETDNTAWPDATVQKIGLGGQTDAIAGSLNGSQLNLIAIGGSGNDRAIRLRAADPGYWAIAGETDSSDFPSLGGTQSASGKDLWIGRLSSDLTTLPALRLFGGSGDEQFGGLAAIPGRGLYLAGTTNSTDLPAASGPYQGGSSDGFIAALDPLTAIPAATTYIGGSGRDEIAAMETSGGELFLGGATDSPDLVLPGLASGDGVAGGLDALFVLCDAFGSPTRGIRFGGSADDRVLGVEPGTFGQVSLAGASQSQDWLHGLDPFAAGLGGQDGFVVSVAFADLRLTPILGGNTQIPLPGDLYLGRDLQANVMLQAVSEDGMDGIVTVRSSDPSRLLVSANSSLPGTDQILVSSADINGYYSPPSFAVQALSDAGEVEVVVEGRSTASPKGIYPRQRLRVKLAPTALFLSSPKEVSAQLNNRVDVTFVAAAVLPDGTPGPAQDVRTGVIFAPALTTSDAAGMPVLPDLINVGPSQGGYRATAQAARVGTYTLTPASSRFPAAPGQSVTVHVTNGTPAISVFPNLNFAVAKDHVAYFGLNGAPGDTLRFSSDDPSRLLIGSNASASATAITFTFTAATTFQNLWLAGMATGTVTLRVDGIYRGQPIAEVTQVQLVPYKVALGSVPSTVGTGVAISLSVTLTPQIAGIDIANGTLLQESPRPEAFASVQPRSSNPAVLRLTGGGPLSSTFVGVQPGTATLDFGPSAPAGFAGLSAVVQVVPATLDFGASTIRIPAGTAVYISPVAFGTAPPDAFQAVRFRIGPGAPITLQGFPATGTDVTVNVVQRLVGLIAQDAKVGQQATLFVSAPGVAEFPIQLRVVESIFVPDAQEVRVVAGNTQQTAGANFTMMPYEGGQIFPLVGRIETLTKITLHPTVTPGGICTVPDSIDVPQFTSVTVPLTCSTAGVAVVALQPLPGLSSAQSQLSVRVVSLPAPPASLGISRRVLTGNGLQSELSMFPASANSNSGPFTGTLTSSDPDRVRLSVDRNAPGTGSVTIPTTGNVRSVFVQGFATEGTVTLTAQSTDGRTGESTVYLFPSTMAVRPTSNSSPTDLSPTLTMDQPLSSPNFTVDVRPYLVEPESKKLIWTSALSIRGGTDPAFIRAQSSDTSIVQPVPPDGLLSEGDSAASLKFHANTTGDVTLSASQPDGFIAVPDSSLRTHVFARGLEFSSAPVLSADLQTAVTIVSPGENSSVPGVIVTSLDPQKLALSSSASTLGQASVTTSPNQPIFLQALGGAVPGDKVAVRLEAPGYITSQSDVTFAAAELQAQDPITPLSLQPLTNAALALVYGPLDTQGRVSFNGSVRPGVNLSLQISSSDTSIVTVGQPSVALSSYMSVPLRTFAPGHVRLAVQAPPQITNRVAAVDVIVSPYQFVQSQVDQPSRYLLSKFTVTNPRPQPTVVTMSGTGMPVRFATGSSGGGIPSVSLTVTLSGNETRTLYLEPAGQGTNLQIQLTASDFAPLTSFTQFVQDPLVKFLQSGPLNLSVGGSAIPITLVLSGQNRESPLGTAYGPLSIQLQSSNPQVVRVPTGPLVFGPGDSRKDALLQPAGRGDAIVSLIVPPGFAGTAPARQDIVVSVR